jgi:DNA-dependent RNA polymerase auxiliary subunit epsilon
MVISYRAKLESGMSELKFFLLRESGTRKDLAVNAYAIKFVRKLDARRVEVVFDKEHFVLVDGAVLEILNELRADHVGGGQASADAPPQGER